jgi:hypothetical protein
LSVSLKWGEMDKSREKRSGSLCECDTKKWKFVWNSLFVERVKVVELNFKTKKILSLLLQTIIKCIVLEMSEMCFCGSAEWKKEEWQEYNYS